MSPLIRCAVFLLCLFALAIPSSQAESSRLVFWNIQWFPGGSPEADRAAAVSQIKAVLPAVQSMNPDVLGMVEILNAEAAELAISRTEGMVLNVCSQFQNEDGQITQQQIAIASRYPCLAAWWEGWKPGPGITPRRGFAFAAYQPQPEEVLLVYALHFKSNRGDLAQNIRERSESARQLLRHAKEMEKAFSPLGKVTVVIGGDFNTSLDDDRFREDEALRHFLANGFSWGWEGVEFADRITLPGQTTLRGDVYPDTCFDHAIVRNGTIQSCRIETFTPDPSDHRPVILELSRKKNLPAQQSE